MGQHILNKSLAQYILPVDVEVKSPVSWDKLFMQHVLLVATKSKDPRTKMGAILVKDGTIISEGYNGFPRGVKDLSKRYADRETKYRFVVHAEANAVLNAVRHGVCTCGSILYTQATPCCECAKVVIQAGIKEIVTFANWPPMHKRWDELCEAAEVMLKEAGVNCRSLGNETLGMFGRCNGEFLSL